MHDEQHSHPTRRSSDLAAWAAWAAWISKPRDPSSKTTKPGLVPGFVRSGVRGGRLPTRPAAMSDAKIRKRRYERVLAGRSEEHTSEHQTRIEIVCRLLL